MNKLTVFTADWCGPCKMLKGVLESRIAAGELTVEYVDVEKDPVRTAEAGVRGVPASFLNDDLSSMKIGALSEDQLNQWLEGASVDEG